jgi:hypothetical protein
VVIFTRLTTRLSERLFGLGPALAIGPRQWPHRTEFAQCKQIASPSDLRHTPQNSPQALPRRRAKPPMDSFSLEALAVPSAHKCRVLVSDRQQFPPLLISKSTAYEPNPKICLPRRGVSRYYLQICLLERAPRSAALGAVRTHPRSSRRLPHPFQHAGHGGAPLRARRALAPPLRICSYRYSQ